MEENLEARPPVKVNIGKISSYVILICLVVYIGEIFARAFFFKYFAISTLEILVHPWSLVSYIFLHGSGKHLLLNLFAIFLFGFILERQIGSKAFAVLFFVSGIMAGLGQAIITPGTSVGASGAVFGIMGMLAVLKPKMVIFVYSMPLPLIVVAIGWIISQAVFINLPDNIGHAAHLFGLITGIGFGLYWRYKIVGRQEEKSNDNSGDSGAQSNGHY